MKRKASAVWQGNLVEGTGNLSSESGVLDKVHYSFSKRFADEPGTNPEELVGAAHAACYSMALSHGLASAGFKPEQVSTNATVHLEKVGEGFKITLIELTCEAKVADIDEATFQKTAEATKTGCPISQALAATEISLKAKLI
ncbi:OsmC family protein [bacterium]|nr:OsmC family protein [bacterium]